MKIEIIKDSKNPAAKFFPSPSNTPETDAAWSCFKGYMEPLQDVQNLSRKLERERDEARAERDILKLDAQREAEHHDLMVKELEAPYDKNAKLRDIAERAIDDFNGCKAQRLRAELNQLK